MADRIRSLLLMVLFLLVLIYAPSQSMEASSSTGCCNVGFVENGSECVCGAKNDASFGGLTKCDTCRNFSRFHNFAACVTEDAAGSEVVAGVCLTPHSNYSHLYSVWKSPSIPITASDLQEVICGPTKRVGTLCGRCDNQTGIDIFSSMMRCISIDDCHRHSWLLYLLSQLGMLTMLTIVLVLVGPNLVTPPLNSLTLISQLIVLPIFIHALKFGLMVSILKPATWLADILIGLYSIWSLDVVDSIVSLFPFPPLCLDSSTTTVQVLALQYIKVVYPLFLITLIGSIKELYACNINLIVSLWGCVSKCFIKFRNYINPRATFSEAAGSLLLLASTKCVCVSLSILFPVPLYNVRGERVRYVLYYDGTTDFFSPAHRPYALLAIAMLLLLVLVPILFLLLYPFIHSICRGRQFRLTRKLSSIADIFQKQFKDRMDGETKEYRFFAGFLLLLRAILVTTFFLYFTFDYSAVAVAAVVLIVYSFLLFSLRPYKNDSHNIIEGYACLYMSLFAILYLQFNASLSFSSHISVTIVLVVGHVLLLGPAVCMAALFIWWLCNRLECRRRIAKLRGGHSRQYRQLSFSQGSTMTAYTGGCESPHGDNEVSFPDRVQRPEDYQPQSIPLIAAFDET